MTIAAGDIKLKKTQVMQDVPEGGGAPTANVVPDGTSNAIFPDVSEVDRAIGRVNLRKLAVHVDTDNVDDYLGANIIIAEPPNDPNISITLFSTGETFDTRTSAVSRMEGYLSIGTTYAGYLFGNHVSGQSTLLLYQKTAALPSIGQTLVLTKREGYSDQHQQYVRVNEASAVETNFEDAQGSYTRFVVTLTLANQLDADYSGFDVARFDYTKAQIALLTKISGTVVADSARYSGVSPLEVEAEIGDFEVKAESMFTQLVPSAQVETPIADARANQLQDGAVSSGSTVSHSLTATFTTAQNLFIGGAIAPNTLSIANGGVTVTDAGGRLMSAGSQVGTVDYANGILSLLTNVFGTGGLTFTIVYAPAATPQAPNQSQGFKITALNRSLNYVRTIEPAPERGTLSISYMSSGRWYVLNEQGDGSIRGQETGYGAGSLNFTTGTWSVTLGALPDVGSALILEWVEPKAARASDLLVLDNNGTFYWPFNSDGESSLEAGAKAFEPGELTITWNDGAARTVTDDGAGNLTGYGTGTVNYAKGTLRLTPTTLPAPGTAINVAVKSAVRSTATVSLASGAGDFGVTDITPGSVAFDITGQLKFQYLGGSVTNWGGTATYRITDDGAGVLKLRIADTLITVGSINYSAGTFSITANTVLSAPVALALTAFDNIYLADNGGLNMLVQVL